MRHLLLLLAGGILILSGGCSSPSPSGPSSYWRPVSFILVEPSGENFFISKEKDLYYLQCPAPTEYNGLEVLREGYTCPWVVREVIRGEMDGGKPWVPIGDTISL